MPTPHLLGFAVTAFALIVVPGPSVLFVVSRGVALGRRAALATVVGNAGGLALQAALVVLGLGSILAESVTAFTAIKLAGAAYLVFLGLRMIRDRRRLRSSSTRSSCRGPGGGSSVRASSSGRRIRRA